MTSLENADFDRWSDGRIRNDTDKNKRLMKEMLDETGPGFCLAKWTQVTMHLGVGLTHSCHHPTAHKIPLDELKTNSSALHNTKFKKEQRKKMLAGERPAECDFCWRIEDNTKEYSDRVYKSLDAYSIYDYDNIKQLTGDENIFPRYVEISFSNVCNFKCSYCGPTFSSKWAEETKNQGAIKFDDGFEYNTIGDVQIKNNEDNPYTETFWKWFPRAVKHMHTFRVTGGEPLMSKHTFKVMEYLLENPNPDLEFAINSNACPPDKLWKKFVKLVAELEEKKCVKKFTLFVSAESAGKPSEYSRRGMDWDKFVSNIDMFLESTQNTRVTYMAAFNVFSVTSFKSFLEYVLTRKRRYNYNGIFSWIDESKINLGVLDDEFKTFRKRTESSTYGRIGIDIPYVRAPQFLDVKIIDPKLIEQYLLPAVDFMYANMSTPNWRESMGFDSWEADKLKRIFVDVLCAAKDSTNPDGTSMQQSISENRAKFYEFIQQFDNRNNLKFADVFPEMSDFYQICGKEFEKVNKKDVDEGGN